ncbi:hypothetical protein GCM10010232_24230 [Streptomyces amakusaensis]
MPAYADCQPATRRAETASMSAVVISRTCGIASLYGRGAAIGTGFEPVAPSGAMVMPLRSELVSWGVISL